MQQVGHTENVVAKAKMRKKSPKIASSSLPERWKHNRRRAAVFSLAAVLLFVGVLVSYDSTASAEERWLGARFSLREILGGAQSDKRIAIVEIDDKSLDNWPNDPLIAWGGYMAQAIEQLTRSGARVIALDWTQPIETDERMKWNNDAKLGAALSQSKGVVFVKFIKPNGDFVLPAPSLLYSIPGAAADGGESSLGYAEAGLQDSDTIWKYIQPVIEDSRHRQVSFAGRVAVKAGFYSDYTLPKQPILINFGNYAGKSLSPFERASFCDVATAKTPDPRWKDKIVFIGATYKGVNDFHYVPFLAGLGGMRQIAGVELQAHAVKTLLDRNEIKQLTLPSIWFLASLLGAMGVVVYTSWNWGRAAFTAIAIALLWVGFSLFVFLYGAFDLPLVLPILSLLLGSLLMGGYRALSEERERAQVMKMWGRQQDPRLINEILAHPELRGGQGYEMQVTVLFADLQNFTKTVEMLPPEQAIAALNRYLSLLSEIILKHGGWLDKYLGDGLMAQWGVLKRGDEHALDAVKACLEIENQLRILTPELRAKGEVFFEVRLTLHSGPVIVGAVGSENREERTIIGDTVNVTSRLQETAKELGCNFLISEITRDLLGETNEAQIAFGKAGQVAIRGRQQPLQVYEILTEQSKLEVL